MSRNRDIEIFGVAFLDLISCGLGAVIILMLIFSSLVRAGAPADLPELATDGLSPLDTVLLALHVDVTGTAGSPLTLEAAAPTGRLRVVTTRGPGAASALAVGRFVDAPSALVFRLLGRGAADAECEVRFVSSVRVERRPCPTGERPVVRLVKRSNVFVLEGAP